VSSLVFDQCYLSFIFFSLSFLTVGVSALASRAMASTGTRKRDQPWRTPRQEGFIAPSQYKTSPGMSCVFLASSSSASL